MTTHKEPLFPFAFEEGRARDWLADKLLSLPALEEVLPRKRRNGAALWSCCGKRKSAPSCSAADSTAPCGTATSAK